MSRNFKQRQSHLVTQEVIVKILRNYFAESDFTYKKIHNGLENINVAVNISGAKFIIRIYNSMQFEKFKRDDENILYELDFMDYLRKNGIPVPEIIRTIDKKLFCKFLIGDKFHYVVCMEYIEGDEVRPNNEQIAEVAKWQAKMHKLSMQYKIRYNRKSDGPIDYYIWWRDFMKSGKRIKSVRIGQELEKTINNIIRKVNPETIADFPSYVIHTDMHRENMRFNGNKLAAIFDFDDCREGIFAEDISMFIHELLKCADTLRDAAEKCAIYFDSYEKTRELTVEEKKMAIYFAMQKMYQLKYFDIYYREQAHEPLTQKINKTKKLLNKFEMFCNLAESFQR